MRRVRHALARGPVPTDASSQTVGLNPRSVAAVLVTHAHDDHIGAAEHPRSVYGVPVLMRGDEVPHARRDFLDQVPVGQVLGQAWRPGVLPWAVHALRGPEPPMFRSASRGPYPCRGPWTCPAPPSPCTPLVTPKGTAYHLPDRGVLVSGDALVTAHPTSRVSGPRLLPDMFHTDRAGALDSLAVRSGSTRTPSCPPANARRCDLGDRWGGCFPSHRCAQGSTTHSPGSLFEGNLVRVAVTSRKPCEKQALATCIGRIALIVKSEHARRTVWRRHLSARDPRRGYHAQRHPYRGSERL
ncbi:MBL fold metallo-hydrolase [Streptomyces sp. NPDC004457]